MKKLFILLLLTIFAAITRAQFVVVKVVQVHDGDTFTVIDSTFQKKKCRFSNIDAPEIGQPYGNTSRDSLKGRVLNKFVKVIYKGKDLYKRNITELYDITGGRYDSLMVVKGWAWNYKEYSSVPWLETLQKNAEKQRVGLWNCEKKYIIEPKVWRKVYKKLKIRLVACP